MAYQPIDNKTRLNTSLFTYISSGGPDYYLAGETNDHIKPWEIIKEAYDNIPNGDRYTLFLNHLYTNYFLIDLNMLSKKKSCIVSFYTTKDFSFSLTRFGNKSRYINADIYLSPTASKWGKGNVRNLEAYFEGYPEDKELYFQFYIYKPTTYQYFIDLEVIDPELIVYFIPKNYTGLKDKVDRIFVCGELVTLKDNMLRDIQDINNNQILCNGVL